MADNLAEVFPPVIRIPDIKNAIDSNSPSLSEIITFLQGETFDPNKVRYEIPFSKKLTPEDLKDASKWMGYEIMVLGFKRDSQVVYRLVTGGVNSVSSSTVFPDLTSLNDEDIATFSGDPILLDNGKFNGLPILFHFHNHEKYVYPSDIDLNTSFGSSNTSIGVNQELVVYGKPERRVDHVSVERIMFNTLLDLGGSQEKYTADVNFAIQVKTETQKRICDSFGVVIRRYKFGRDDDKIQEYLDSIQNI